MSSLTKALRILDEIRIAARDEKIIQLSRDWVAKKCDEADKILRQPISSGPHPKVGLFELESSLIDPDLWKKLYDRMPQPCKEVVDNREPCSIGIGYRDDTGWFIMFSGQGPGLGWIENDKIEIVE